MLPPMRVTPLLIVLPMLVGACASKPPAISHVVLIDLHDAADAPAAMADCERLLRPIPSVRSLLVGRHIDTGRANVLADYDLGLVIAFDDPAGYSAYVDHPRHVQLVETWRDRMASIRVIDVAQTGSHTTPDDQP